MHMKASDHPKGPMTIPVRIILEDPTGMNEDGSDKAEHEVMAAQGEHLLEVAIRNGVNIEHACGAVCACSTCHVYVEQGMECLSEPTEAEDDRVEEAPGIQVNSRLSCQCDIEKAAADGKPIVMRVPAWNRNAVKEVPH